jgi:hypothetical protein
MSLCWVIKGKVKMKIISLAFLMLYMLNEYATAAPILRNASPMCASIHSEIPSDLFFGDSLSDADLFNDITGPVKKVVVNNQGWNDFHREYFFDKNGRLTQEGQIYPKRSGGTVWSYEYDDRMRRSKIISKAYNKKGILEPFLVSTYKYIDQKNMVVLTQNNLEQKRWINISAAVSETSPDGQNVCYLLVASPSDTSGTKYVSRKNELFRQLHPPGLSPYPVAKSEKEADTILLSVLTDLKSANENNCSGINYTDTSSSRWDCYSEKISLDNDLYKSVNSPAGYGWQWDRITWYNKNGLEVEYVKNFSEKLASGKIPHDIFKYQLDSYGNWIVKNKFREMSPGLTNDQPKMELIDTTTRNIEYFDAASAETH